MIEVLQLITHRGFAEIDDLISNTLGVLTGYEVYCLGKQILEGIKEK